MNIITILRLRRKTLLELWTVIPNVEISNSQPSLPSKLSNNIATSTPSSGEGLGGGFSLVGGIIGGFGGGSGGGRF